MKRFITLIVLGMILSYSSSAAISGTPSLCVGGSTVLTDPLTGGIWSSSIPTVATVVSTSGIVSGLSPGVTTISYTVGATTETMTVTVNSNPLPIGGSTSLCIGSSTTFTDAVAGGVWTSSVPSVLNVNLASGFGTGLSAGVAFITYTLPTGCHVEVADTVYSSTPAPIIGPSSVCAGITITLLDTTPGGAWSSSNTAVATVSPAGIVTGVAAGTAIISYSYTSVCGIGAATLTVTVDGTPSAGSITGPSTVSVGDTILLADIAGGGTWSSGDPSIATIDAAGDVVGIAPGTCIITYTVSGSCGPVFATATITVTPVAPVDGVSGNVLFTGTAYAGSVRVWLITYNTVTHMLQATDSVTVTSSGSSAHYSFTGVPTDSFRVKAATLGTSSPFGYMPTYYISSSVWSTATVIFHTSGTSDTGKNIIMNYGTAATGPGFIAGDVTMGANKGTAGSIPAVGMLMYLENNSSGTIMQQTYTDAAGHYSFDNLMVGQVYKVYPEMINYATTPYSTIILTTSNPSKNNVSFVQHTISHTITPVMSGTGVMTEQTGDDISLYPNPSTGKINITWKAISVEDASVTVTDITGREIFKTIANMSTGSGSALMDLSGAEAGLYMITIKSATVHYTNKIQIIK